MLPRMSKPNFLFTTCQLGAEAALKREVARRWPHFRFSYSRPGFLTFRLPDGFVPDPEAKFSFGCVFARAYAFSFGKAAGASDEERAESFWKLAAALPFQKLHVWQRDAAMPGHRGFEPGPTESTAAAEAAIRRHAPTGVYVHPNPIAGRGQLVLDCILVSADEWWVGWHRAEDLSSRLPGGMHRIEVPANVESRAYRKMEEALRWSRLPIRPGDRCVEIGCAPGGASQALLARGLSVTGIDPALPSQAVLDHPNFVHVRKRGSDVRRQDYRKMKWLFADVNLAPKYTLDMVEGIVTHPTVNVRGMLLTLKLLDWRLADEVPAYLERVRAWGYQLVDARQLAHNRQEICLAALRRKPVRQRPRRRVNRKGTAAVDPGNREPSAP